MVRDVLSIPKVEEDKCLLLIPVLLLDPIIVCYLVMCYVDKTCRAVLFNYFMSEVKDALIFVPLH